MQGDLATINRTYFADFKQAFGRNYRNATEVGSFIT